MPRACGMRAQRKPAIWHQLVLRNLRNAGSYLLGPPSTHGLKKSMGQPTELAICDGTKHKPSISEQNWGMFCLVGKMHVATRHNVVDIRQTYRHMMSQKSDFVFLYMFWPFESFRINKSLAQGTLWKQGIPEPSAQWPMVVKELLEMRVPPILILVCLLTLWNTQMPHSVEICLIKKCFFSFVMEFWVFMESWTKHIWCSMAKDIFFQYKQSVQCVFVEGPRHIWTCVISHDVFSHGNPCKFALVPSRSGPGFPGAVQWASWSNSRTSRGPLTYA